MQRFFHALSIAVTLSCLCWHCQGQDAVCEPVTCTDTNKCEFGFQYDENDCQTCSCYPNPCEGNKCPAGEVCTVQTVECIRAPCYPVASCSPPEGTDTTCEPVSCTTSKCAFGFQYDENGCQTCSCYPNPCEGHECPAGEVCAVETVKCQTAPCYPAAGCSLREELPVYKPGKPGSCPAVVPGRPGKCQRSVCSSDADCARKLKCCSTACGARTCKKPVKRCPTRDPCAIRCAYGLKYDKNCCQLCQCRANPCSNYRCPLAHQVCLPVADSAAADCDRPFKPSCVFPGDK